MQELWDEMRSKYVLNDARVIAAVRKGGAILETCPRLEVAEGRDLIGYGGSKGDHLEYQLIATPEGVPDFDASEAVQARIVIEGMFGPTAQRVEIRGDGWFGYDDHGAFEARFDEAPVMLMGEPPVQEPSSERRAKPSGEYLRAVHARPLHELEEDD